MSKKLLSLALVIALVVSLFVPFGALAADPVKLRFIDVSPSPARQEYFGKIFDAYKQQTGVEVVYESVPWDDAANKLTVLGAAHQLPDIMCTWEGWLGQYKASGWVKPLDSYIAGTEDQYTDVVTKMLWNSQKDLYGAIYTVPDGLMVKGIYVRKDWCDELGIKLDPDAGWTYDEYFDLVAKLTDPAKKRYGASYRGARGAFDPLLTYLEGLGGNDGQLYNDDGTVRINTPECIEGFKKWTNIYLGGSAPKDAINWGFLEMVDNFTGGLTGTLINDSEVAVTCAANMKEGTWMAMPIPRNAEGKLLNTIGSPYAYAISGDCQVPDEAWKLIDFLTQPANNIEYCKMSGQIPIKKDVAGDPTYGENGMYRAFVKQLNNPDMIKPCMYGPFDYTDMHQGMLHEEVQKYLLGQQSAEDAIGHISAELETRMKQYLADNPGSKVETPKAIEK